MSPFDERTDSDRSAAVLESRLPRQCPRGMRGWISAVLGVVIFLAGGVCGASLMRVASAPKPLGDLKELPARVAGFMQRDLGLSAAQRASIETIVREHQPELHRIRMQTFPEMRAELGQVVEEMAAVLTPAQARRFLPEAERRLEVHFPSAEMADGEEQAQ